MERGVSMRVLFTGGGTAGHVNPALAAAEYLKEKKPNVEILFVGNKGGIEERLVPPAGYDIKCISISGFQRRLTPKNIVRNFKTLGRLVSSSIQASKIIDEFKPDVCIGTGGYVTGPVIREAAKKKIPCVVHESNAYPGITTKLVSKYVYSVMLAVEDAKKYFDSSVRIDITGNPVRPEIIKEEYLSARKELNLDDRPVILSMGGSLGAEKINNTMIELLNRTYYDNKYQHIHGTGYGKITQEMTRLKEAKHKDIRILEYVDMPLSLAAADLVISRAGAISITEIAAKAKASVLIPSPYVTENHQFHNAMSLVKIGAADIIEEKDLNFKILEEKVDSILAEKDKAKIMGENAEKLYINDANERIYNIIIEAAYSKAN